MVLLGPTTEILLKQTPVADAGCENFELCVQPANKMKASEALVNALIYRDFLITASSLYALGLGCVMGHRFDYGQCFHW